MKPIQATPQSPSPTTHTAGPRQREPQLRFRCPSCGGRVKVPLACAGRKGKCHHCRGVIRIPAAPQREARQGGVFQAPAAPRSASSSDLARAREPVSGWESLDARIERALAELPPGARTPASSAKLQLLPPCQRYREPAPEPQRRARSARSPRSSRSCSRCGLLHEERGAVCAACRSERRSRRAPRDLAGEAHVRALAFWQMLPGGLGVLLNLLGAALIVALAPGPAASAAVLPMLLVGLPLCALGFGFGYCLWRYHGWARWLTVIGSGLALLGSLASLAGGLNLPTLAGTLLGVVWHGAVIHVLVGKPHIFAPAYRDAALGSRRPVPFWSSPFFWIPALVFGLGLLALAFTISQLIALLG